ncbi:kinase-like protein [Schizopora paradoxa]|uniref:Kinase-like protein n=1 Tax=Schizopora paradoxa TaxID=27342 RepID=A0A0H2RWX0_9AGAM|nr:kinase-like protein [Schizopora paradoxa]
MDKLEKILSEIEHLRLDGQIVNRTNITKHGSSCDVYRAWSKKHMKVVAVKHLRQFIDDNPSFAKRLAREIKVWASLAHENVLPFLGFFSGKSNKMPRLVSEWMEDGTMTDYMKTFPRCSLQTLKMLHGIASGLAYLHEMGVIHADLKTPNVLISKQKTPLLTDFGLSKTICPSQTTEKSIVISSSTNNSGGTVRWMAREFFAVSPDPAKSAQKHDERTDVWAYGMVVYELITWKFPYADKINDLVAMFAIANGELPALPPKVGETDIFHKLWDLCQLCWKDRLLRPTAVELIKHGSFVRAIAAKISNGNLEETERQRCGAKIENIFSPLRSLDFGGWVPCEWSGSIGLGRLYSCRLVPGWSEKQNRKISVKRLSVSLSEDMELAEKLATDISKWAKLCHEFVLPPIGYFIEGETMALNLVYESVNYTSLHSYMFGQPYDITLIWYLLIDIASGLEYLHDQSVVNAGLRSHNILVFHPGKPVLVGFDVPNTLPQTTMGTSSDIMKHTVRWMAVELLEIEFRGEYTKETDVWAFGMVAYELLCGKFPYHMLNSNSEVSKAIAMGGLPSKPTKDRSDLFDELWKICLTCWKRNPSERPSSSNLLSFISQIPFDKVIKSSPRDRVKLNRTAFDEKKVVSQWDGYTFKASRSSESLQCEIGSIDESSS